MPTVSPAPVADPPPVPFVVADRRTMLRHCMPLALFSTYLVLVTTDQVFGWYLSDVPKHLLACLSRLWWLVTSAPFSSQTTSLTLTMLSVGLLLTVFFGIGGGSTYVMLSVTEDILRILLPLSLVQQQRQRRLFPRKVWFRISLPVGVAPLPELLSAPVLPSFTSQPLPGVEATSPPQHQEVLAVSGHEQVPTPERSQVLEASREEQPGMREPLPLKRISFFLLNQFALQIEPEGTAPICIHLPQRKRWKALLALLATRARTSGMQSDVIAECVGPEDSSDPQRWFYKIKDRLNAFFREQAQAHGLVAFDVIQERAQCWWLGAEGQDVRCDLDEFDHRCQQIKQYTQIEGNREDSDALLAAGSALIALYGQGYLPHFEQEVGCELWIDKERERVKEAYLTALLQVATQVKGASQQYQGERRLLYERATATCYLEYALAASTTLKRAIEVGEPALRQCFACFLQSNAHQEARNAYLRYQQQMEQLCGVWMPMPETQRLWTLIQEMLV